MKEGDLMKNLRAIRMAKGLSQAEVARELNISRQAYYNYETGKREADYETLLRLGELLDVSVEELIRDDPEKLLQVYKNHSESMQKENAPNDEVRSAIIEKVNDMSDEQAKKFLDFLNSFPEWYQVFRADKWFYR